MAFHVVLILFNDVLTMFLRRTDLASWRTDLTVEREQGHIHGAGTAVDAVRNPNHCPVEVDKHVHIPLGDLRVCPAKKTMRD